MPTRLSLRFTSARRPPPQGRARLLAVVEVDAAIGEHLVGLVPFTGNEHEIAGLRQLDGHVDGPTAVGLDIHARRGCGDLADANQDVRDDALRRLRRKANYEVGRWP